MGDETSDKKPRTVGVVGERVAEGLILLVSAPLAYAVAYSYEAGFALHFGYPTFLIQIDLRGALVAWLVLLTAILIVLQAVVTFLMYLPPRIARIIAIQAVFSLPYLFVAVTSIYGLLTHKLSKWLALPMFVSSTVVWALVLWMLLVRPLVSNRFQGTKVERLERALERLFHTSHLKALRAIFWTPGLARSIGLAWLSVFVFLGSLSLAVYLGSWSAGRQQLFLVKHMPREIIAVRRYGDQVIAASFDPNANEIICRYLVVPLVDRESEPWTLLKLHPPRVVTFSRQEPC